jgi:hypothetical protein
LDYKQQLKAKSTLCELADRIDSRLKEEERWNQFHEYKQSTTTNTTSTSGQDLFPMVTKTLNKYLTDPISNTIKTEISQCLFINAIMIEPNNEEMSHEQVCCISCICKTTYTKLIILLFKGKS